jgi:hypothetical protein
MAVASTALVVALGGTSYAAVKLPKNSVGSKQIKSNAVTSPKVKNGSLLAADFAAGQLPAGAKGDQGERGAQGERGPRGDTGTVDTSNFYDKAASDSRFLGAAGTAADSSKIGGLGLTGLVKGGGDRIFTQATTTGGSSNQHMIGELGHLNYTCSDPASTESVSFTLAPSRAGSVYTETGAANPAYQQLAAGGTTSPAVSSNTTDHVTFFVASGIARYQISVWSDVAPGGNNSCEQFVVYDGGEFD